MLTVRTRALRVSDGFTLVELLVAMSAGMLVMFAASTLLITSMHQSQQTFTRVDATRQARTMLANLENQLHSACVNGTSPIQGTTAGGTTESDGNDLVYVSYLGTSPNPQATWHQVTFNSTAGTLTDTAYTATYVSSSTGSYWQPGASPTSTTTLLTRVAAVSGTPVFKYYAYSQYPDASGNIYWAIQNGSDPNPLTGATLGDNPLDPAGAALSAASAQSAVEVAINLVVGPSGSNLSNASLGSANVPVSDSISLRLTTPPDYTPAGTTATGYGPCQ